MAVIRGQPLVFEFYVWNISNNQPVTGDAANITVRVSKDGGALTTASGSVTEVDSTHAPGMYRIVLTASEMDANAVSVYPRSTTANVRCMSATFYTDRGNISAIRAQTDVLQFYQSGANAFVRAWVEGTAPSAVTSASFASGAITASAIAADAIGASELASDAVQEIAAAILQNPANKLATDASGRVTAASVGSDVNVNMAQTVPTSPTANTVGDALRRAINNLNVTVSSRAAPGDAMALTSAERASVASAVWSATTRTLTSAASVAAEVADAVWSASTRTLTSFGTLVGDVAQAVWGVALEGTWTALKLMRLFAAALLGKVSGAQNNTPVFRSVTDTKNRITMQVDSDGNRTSVTLDGD